MKLPKNKKKDARKRVQEIKNEKQKPKAVQKRLSACAK